MSFPQVQSRNSHVYSKYRLKFEIAPNVVSVGPWGTSVDFSRFYDVIFLLARILVYDQNYITNSKIIRPSEKVVQLA